MAHVIYAVSSLTFQELHFGLGLRFCEYILSVFVNLLYEKIMSLNDNIIDGGKWKNILIVTSRFAAIRKNVRKLPEQKDEATEQKEYDNIVVEQQYLDEVSLKLWLKKPDILSDKQFCDLLAKQTEHISATMIEVAQIIPEPNDSDIEDEPMHGTISPPNNTSMKR
eukprot:83230_1